jgi:small basic protein (TIGR04137 family)
MTIDKSLKIRRGGMGNRNVLTRVERIQKLEENERWQEGDPLMGLPKVRVQKVTLKKKKKVKKEEGEEATEATSST